MRNPMVPFGVAHENEVLDMHSDLRAAANSRKLAVMNSLIDGVFEPGKDGKVYTDRNGFDVTFLGGFHSPGNVWDNSARNERLLAPGAVPEYYTECMRRADKVRYATGDLFYRGALTYQSVIHDIGLVLRDLGSVAEYDVRYSISKSNTLLEGVVSFNGLFRSFRPHRPDYETVQVELMTASRHIHDAEARFSSPGHLTFGAVGVREVFGIGDRYSTITTDELFRHRDALLDHSTISGETQ